MNLSFDTPRRRSRSPPPICSRPASPPRRADAKAWGCCARREHLQDIPAPRSAHRPPGGDRDELADLTSSAAEGFEHRDELSEKRACLTNSPPVPSGIRAPPPNRRRRESPSGCVADRQPALVPEPQPHPCAVRGPATTHPGLPLRLASKHATAPGSTVTRYRDRDAGRDRDRGDSGDGLAL